MYIHKNARTTPFVRNLIQTTTEKKSVFCERYGISRQTFCKWRERDGVEDKASKPVSTRRKLTAEADSLICEVKKKTDVSAKYILQILKAINIDVSLSTVYRCFKLYNLLEKQKPKYKSFKSYSPGFVHVDVTYLPKFNGQKYYLYVAIDRCTRLVFAKIYKNKSAENTVSFMSEAEKFFPFDIKIILTDNGKEFCNYNSLKDSKLDKWSKQRNIIHRHTKPYKPNTNGMVERFNGIIKRECIKREKFLNIEELQSALNNYICYYNNSREHGSIVKEYKDVRLKTPMSVADYYKLRV